MKKTILASALLVSLHGFSQNIAFDKLYGNGDPVNYFLGHFPVNGSDGLNIHWYGGIKFGTAAGDVMQISNTGNVGIGTTTWPHAKLDVAGGINIANSFPIQLSGHDVSHGLRYNLYFSDNTTLLDGPFLYGYDGGSLGTKRGNTETQILNWKYNGNVGIGTYNPQAKLDVKNGSILVGNDYLGGGEVYFGNPNHGIVRDGNILKIFTAGGAESSLSFGHNDVRDGSYTEFLKISYDGKMSLQNKFEAKEVKVTLTPTADFVFAQDYALPKLEDVEKFVTENKHLPEVASAEEMKKEGVNIGEFQIKLLQKIEELTLYSIEQNNQIKSQNAQLQHQHKKIEELEKEIKLIRSKKQ